MNKTYLGDGVYVAMNEAHQVVLTAEDGGPHPIHQIFLEPEVMDGLLLWLREQRQLTSDREEL